MSNIASNMFFDAATDVAVDAAATAAPEAVSNIELFVNTLPIMLQGMLGIFVVLIVIYLLIAVLNKATAPRGGNAGAADATSTDAN